MKNQTKILHQELKSVFGERFIYEQEKIDYQCLNTGNFDRTVTSVVQPIDVAEISQLVSIANKFYASLYPVSTGKNWGLGSKLPVKDHNIIVDLSLLNKIEINQEYGYTLIEPGVTQGQLYDYIQKHQLPFIMNVTGSGRDTSVLGNALDRGDGYFNLRIDDILGLEIMLGNGQVLKTGFGHYKNANTKHLYPHGIGPSLNGLFSQSNYGIITKAAIQLIPQKELHTMVVCGLNKQSQLADFIDDIAYLRRQEIWNSIVHIANKARTTSTFVPILAGFYQEKKKISYSNAHKIAHQYVLSSMNNAWTAGGALSGTKEQVKTNFILIKKRLSRYGRVMLISDKKIERTKKWLNKLSFIPSVAQQNAVLQAITPLFKIVKGIPTNETLKSLYWNKKNIPTFAQPQHHATGTLFILPLIPLKGKYATELIEITKEKLSEAGLNAYITLNTFNTNTLGAVINVLFDKEIPGKSVEVKAKLNELHYLYREKGYIPYRVSIDDMEQITDKDDTFWQTVRDMKKTFDPNNIIAPGRYNLI